MRTVVDLGAKPNNGERRDSGAKSARFPNELKYTIEIEFDGFPPYK